METKELTKVQIRNRILANLVPQFDETALRNKYAEMDMDEDEIKGAISAKKNKWMKAHKSEIETAESMNFATFLTEIDKHQTAKKLLCDFIGCSDLSVITPKMWSIDVCGNLKCEAPEKGLSNLIDAILSEKTAKEERNKLAVKQAESREDYNNSITKLAKEFVLSGANWADLTKQLSIAIEQVKIEFGKFEAQKKADKERLTNNYWHADKLVQTSLHKLLALAVSQKMIDEATANNQPIDENWKKLGKAKKAKLIGEIKKHQSTRKTIKFLLSK